MKRIGIIGSRKRNTTEDFKTVKRIFEEVYRVGDIIISGGCPQGGDYFAEMIANMYNTPICIFPANWKEYGRSAGFRRNTYIAEQSDTLIACVAEDRKGGTKDTIKKYMKTKRDLILC